MCASARIQIANIQSDANLIAWHMSCSRLDRMKMFAIVRDFAHIDIYVRVGVMAIGLGFAGLPWFLVSV